ncbi:MAG: sulfatase-like hydrolase/transferase, partial [Clostridiales bacterium]|nr:sulfatase-like hydrolase/transferase [Clostridiales bacterium]
LSGVYSDYIKSPEEKTAVKAMELMDKYAQGNKPWHLRVEFSGPHVPWIIPKRYDNLVNAKEIKKPANFYEDFENKPTIQKRQHRNANLCSCYHDWEWTSRNLIRYYGYISLIDDVINRLLDKLDSLKLTQDTIIIFTSDHGELAGAHNRIGKGELPYDELYHIPMIVSWPGRVEPGSSCDELVMLHDLCPTMLDMLDIGYPDNLHAKSILDLLLNESDNGQIRKQVLIEHHGTFQPLMIRILRDKRGKYCFNPFDFDEFYDLEKDPGELNNLINDISYQSTIQNYRNRLLAEQASVEEKWSEISYWFLSETGNQG